MLLNLKVGESFEFQDLSIIIKILEIKAHQVRIDLTYPDGTKVHKTETIERLQQADEQQASE